MKTRNGKIARLPFEIRERLNHRLLENEPVSAILNWLNSDSTVKFCMETLFEGRAITEQNVSEWRQGGYEEWLAYRSCLGNVGDLSENAARVALTGINAEHLLLVLTATFADLLQRWDTTEEIAFNRKLIVLQHLIKTALSMRRSEQKDARLQLDRERIEILREKNSDKSPSSSSHRASSLSSAHPSAGRPSHPMATEHRRPPVPQPARECSDDDDWSVIGLTSCPDSSGSAPHHPSGGPAVTAVPTVPAPPPTGSREPATSGATAMGEPTPQNQSERL